MLLRYDDDYPTCEHCGVLEVGSCVFDDGGTTWCLGCALANGEKVTQAQRRKEIKNKITAHQSRIAELENEFECVS
jgi:hypothetical protein